MRISDWSSDVCSSDLGGEHVVEIERGVQLFFGLEAIGDADDKGMRTVMTTLNGQLRTVFVRDRPIAVETRSAERSNTPKPGQVAAPFSGGVRVKIAGGYTMTAGLAVASGAEGRRGEKKCVRPCGYRWSAMH